MGCLYDNARTYAIAVALHADELNTHPAVFILRVVAQKVRGVVEVVYYDVQVAVVVVVKRRSTAAYFFNLPSRSSVYGSIDTLIVSIQ